MEYYCFQVSAPAHHRHFTSEKQKHHPTDTVTDDFIVDDLLVFPTDDDDFVAEGGGTSTDSSITAAVDSSNSSSHCGGADHSLARDGGCRHLVDNDNQFSNLCTPYDDLAEFEWMSDFIDESFSNEDVQKLQLLSGLKARPETNNPIFSHGTTIPVKPRTKRARATSVHWTSPLAVMLQNSKPETVSKKRKKTPLKNTNDDDDNNIDDDKLYSRNEEGRMCLHCGSKKTPQWRTGPMGPRTLCNACGVRYKSGRLVPEYRPAASPTFVVTKHSNSHRKVLELRRQKMHNQFMNHDDVMLGMANAGGYYNLIRQL